MKNDPGHITLRCIARPDRAPLSACDLKETTGSRCGNERMTGWTPAPRGVGFQPVIEFAMNGSVSRCEQARASRSAFTLLETMLALGLSAMLLAAIYAAIDQSWKLTSSGHEEMERAQLARSLIHRFELDVRAITYVPPPPVDDSATSDTTTSSSPSGSSGSSSIGSSGGSSGSGGGSSGGSSSGSKSGSSGGSKSGSGGGSGGGSSSGSSSSSSSSSSTTSSTDTTDTEPPVPNSKSVGVRGTNLQLEMSIARPRRDLLTGNAATMSPSNTSDLRAVTYAFLPPGSSSMSGLVRTEGDRMAVEVVEAGGSSATQISSIQMLAPEVVAVNFRYFDGRVWSDSWDSETMARIPRAVEILIAFAPPRRRPALFGSGASQSMNTFRTVILIPVSDPFPKEFAE